MLNGLDKYCLKCLSQVAPTAPSTTRWSQLKVTVNTCAAFGLPSGPGTSLLSVFPTARMQACGGLITAEKLLIPNMPKLEIVKVPPWNSCGCSFPVKQETFRQIL